MSTLHSLGGERRGEAPPPWLAAVAVSPLALPRAGALTDALLAPRRAVQGPDQAFVAQLVHRLAHVVTPTTGTPRVRSVVRVGPYELACALAGRAPARVPFTWHARSARRTIGLAAVRALHEGAAATPADAVARVLADPSGPFGVGGVGPGSCADWLASLAPAARAVAGADAVGWATHLWTGLEWGRLGPDVAVGGPDRWWLAPGDTPLAVRGRADVRIGGTRGTHLTVLDGHPRPSTRTALVLSALVDAVRGGADALAARVVGWWPASGRAWAIDVDEQALDAAVEGVGLAVRAALGAGDVLPAAVRAPR